MGAHDNSSLNLMLALGLRLVMLAVFLGVLIRGVRKNSTYKKALGAYRRGDYRSALGYVEKLRKNGQETRTYCFYRGAFLVELGEAAEAETYLQRAVLLSDAEARTDDRLKALTHDMLGEGLLEWKRYDESLREFASALHYWPTHGGTHRTMAEVWLRRGTASAEALQLARVAVEEERTVSPMSASSHRINLSEALATLAWAVAVTERDGDKVDANVKKALDLAGSNSIPTFARVRFYSGQAYAALGNFERSLLLLDEAASRDVSGRWGKLAREKAAEVRGSRVESTVS